MSGYERGRKIEIGIPKISPRIRQIIEDRWDSLHPEDEDRYNIERSRILEFFQSTNPQICDCINELGEYPEAQKSVLEGLDTLIAQLSLGKTRLPIVSSVSRQTSSQHFQELFNRDEKANVYAARYTPYTAHVKSIVDLLKKENPELLGIVLKYDPSLEQDYSPTKSLSLLNLFQTFYFQTEADKNKHLYRDFIFDPEGNLIKVNGLEDSK